MTKAVIYIVFMVALFSCKKNNDYPIQLISSKHQILSYPKVYTTYGEITNKTISENYIKAWSGEYFYFNIDTTITFTADTITFKKSDTVIFPHQPIDWGKRVVKRNGDYLYFYMVDTLMGYKRADNVLNGIASNIGMVKPFYKDSCPFGVSCLVEWVYDAYIATGTPNQLEFPFLTYKVTRTVGGSRSGLARKINNVFDISVLNLLQDGDTLAIQTSKLVYNRRN
jgi:hypothetical protein